MPSPWTVLISVHAVAASYALIFGAVNLLRRTKGGKVHRVIGRIWAAAMYVVVLTSFGIRTIDGGFNWLHGLSLLTFCTLSLGLWAAWQRRIRAHRSFLTGSYFGWSAHSWASSRCRSDVFRRWPPMTFRSSPSSSWLLS